CNQLAAVSAAGDRIVIVSHGHVGGASAGADVDAHAIDEVVHAAADGIERDADLRRPVHTIAGTAVDDVVRVAAAFKAAIGPGEIDVPGAVDGCRRQSRATQIAGFTVAGSVGDADRCRPALAAIGRLESRHASVEIGEWNDDMSVGLNYRIAADAEVTAAGG